MLNEKPEPTKEEEEKNQHIAKICSLIRTLQSIESDYNSGHIGKESYIKETNKIIEQYNNAKNAYLEYEGLDNFVKNNKLEDCIDAINRLKERWLDSGSFRYSPKIQIQKMMQYFSDLNLILDVEEALFVGDIVEMYLELWNSLEDLKNLINIQNEDIIKIKQCYLNLKNNRNAADILTDEDKKQMKRDLEVASSTVSKQLNSP